MGEVATYSVGHDLSDLPARSDQRPGFPPADDDNLLWDWWSTVRRHGWLIFSTALCVIAAATLYAFTSTPLYTAQTLLLIERKAPQVLRIQDARGDTEDFNNTAEFYRTQYEILKSPALAERIIRGDGFANSPFFTAAIPPSKTDGQSTPNVRQTATRLINGYLSMLQVKPISGTSLVQVKFTTPDPALSAQLANAHAEGFIRYGIDLRSRTNDEASAFLQQKLGELKQRVQQSEAALNDYRRDKGIISVDDRQNVVLERLLDLNKNLTAAEAERIGLEAQVRTIRGRNSDELPEVLGSTLISSLKTELGKLEAEYASLSREFKPGYPALDNMKARVEEARRRLESEMRNQVKAIEAPYLVSKAKEAELRARMEEQKKLTLNLKDSAVQYAILAREVDMNRQLYDGVLQRLKEIGVAAKDHSSNIYIVGQAEIPTFPSQPNKRLIVLVALCMGPAIGFGLAFLLQCVDNTFQSPEDAERYLRLPNLAVVPDFAFLTHNRDAHHEGFFSHLIRSARSELPSRFGGRSMDRAQRLLSEHHPMSVVTEAYRNLRSLLLLSQAGEAPQVVLFTSAICGEGKSTSVINTAMIFAQMNVPVLIIDADLRRPRCHSFLKMNRNIGLTEHLTGQVDLENAVVSTGIDNLSLMSSGALPPNPAELLGSRNMQDTLRILRRQYQFIFIDSSPVMAVSDALALSIHTDGVLLVIDRKTPKQLAKRALTRLATMRSKLLGLVLNRADLRMPNFSGYYHHYYEYETQTTAGNPAQESSKEFLEVVSVKLTEAIGPMARRVLDEHIRMMGASVNSFPHAKWGELIERICEEIPPGTLRQVFENEITKELETCTVRFS
jgi:capsular exopolysaccharide synthesis family protein